MRFKNRYLVCELNFPTPSTPSHLLNSRAITQAVKQSLCDNFGDVAAAHAAPSLTVKYYSPVLSLVIIRASRDTHRTVWAAVTLVDHVRLGDMETGICIRVVHVGGTIRSCQDAAVKHVKHLERIMGDRVDKRLATAAQQAKKTLGEMDG